MPRWSWYERISSPRTDSLHKLLGELEVRIMEYMWQHTEATVRDVAEDIQQARPLAYTTVMTVMGHLTRKGLLSRERVDRKTYIYRVALTRAEFLGRASQLVVDALLEDFGDLALAQFIQVVAQVDSEHLKELRRRVQETKGRFSKPVEDDA